MLIDLVSLVTTLCVVTIFGRSASFPFLMLFLLSDNFGPRAAEERSHAEHGNEDKANPVPMFTNHIIVIVNSIIYDPSYGKRFANTGDFQKGTVGGFANFGTKVLRSKLGDQSTNQIKSLDVLLFRESNDQGTELTMVKILPQSILGDY